VECDIHEGILTGQSSSFASEHERTRHASEISIGFWFDNELLLRIMRPYAASMDSQAKDYFSRACSVDILRGTQESKRSYPICVMSLIAFPTQPKTALVLAGGGSLGAAQVGMLRALVEGGIDADLVVGTSVGAINAAYFAADPTREGIAKMEALWLGLKRTDVIPLNWRALSGFLRRRDHLLPSDGLRRLLDLHLPYRNLEDAALPVHVVATDILTGEAVVLSHGSATQAVLASSAIPAAFPPVEINGRLLCDGALASNTPVRAAVSCGARRLIVLPTGTARRLQGPPRSVIASALHAITLLTTRQLSAELSDLGATAECYVVPTDGSLGGSPFDFSRSSELLERAYHRTLQWLADDGLNRGKTARQGLRQQTRKHSQFSPSRMADDDARHGGSPHFVSAPQALGLT
jgi:NTE family protein